MRITLFFINWNDSFYLPFIKKHYGRFCQRIVMYDNHSDDNSVEIATALGMEVRYFGRPGELNDNHYLHVKNHCWKEERGIADYVIVCDADEFLVLKNASSYSCPTVTGYNMVSKNLPVNDIFEVTRGVMDLGYSKHVIFDPNKMYEIRYRHGCHDDDRIGDLTEGGNSILYHMRMIGGVERLLERHRVYAKRVSGFNVQNRLGWQYWQEEQEKRRDWENLMSQSSELIFPKRLFL